MAGSEEYKDETLLLLQVSGGDRVAYETIYPRYVHLLLKAAYKRLEDKQLRNERHRHLYLSDL